MDSSPKAAAPQVLVLLPPSSPDPRSASRAVAPCVPAAMSSPPPAPPAAAAVVAAEKRPFLLPSPMKKLKQFFVQAVSRVFGGMDRPWGVAMIGIHALITVIKVAASFTTDPEVARFWAPFFRAWLYLGVAFGLLVVFLEIRYLAGMSDPLQQQPAAPAALQLPPPPPEMDMC